MRQREWIRRTATIFGLMLSTALLWAAEGDSSGHPTGGDLSIRWTLIENVKDSTSHLGRWEITNNVKTFTFKLRLYNVLSALGMEGAFSAEQADFSGITGGRDLFISAALHQAFVEVNEEGTEAAAATAIVMAPTGLPQPIPLFKADRPFIFLIRDSKTESILFIGKVMDPLE